MNVSALVSLATIENITAHHGIARLGDEVVLRVLLPAADPDARAVVPTRYAIDDGIEPAIERA